MAVPKLRFPEFNGEWEEKKFQNVARFSKGKNISKDDISREGIPCIRYGELYTTYNEKIIEPISKTNLNPNELVLSEKNDIIIPTSGETAIDIATAACLMKKDVAIGGDTTIIKIKGNGLFFSYYLNSNPKKLARLAQGASVVHLYSTYLKKLDLNIPNINEQKKIASFLSKVDEKIEKLEKKLELWETYKKGIMQQIFSQKLRFKDENGEEYPDWEEKKFNRVFEFIPTNSFSRADLNEESGEVYNIHYGDIHTKFPPILDFDKVKVPFINQEVDLERIKTESYCQNGDLIIADASEDYKDIGKAIELTNLRDKKVLAGLHTLLARDKTGFTKAGYRSYIMLDNRVKLQIKKYATGVSVLGISKSNLGKIDLNIPSLLEQNKIAGFLSSIDCKIEQINEELEIHKEFKLGLLQQMFC